MKFYDDLDKATIERYSNSINHLNLFLKKYLKDYNLSFEPFINVAHSKSVINVKMAYKLNNDLVADETYAIEQVLIESIHSTINKCLKYYNFEQIEFILSENNIDDDTDNLLKIIEKYNNFDYESDLEYQIKKPKYLLFGDNSIEYIDKMVGFVELIESEPYFWCKFNDIKLFYIKDLKHIYLSNAPILDLNSARILYNDTLNADIKDLKEAPEHKGIITLNTIIASKIDLIKITISDNKDLYKNYLKNLKKK